MKQSKQKKRYKKGWVCGVCLRLTHSRRKPDRCALCGAVFKVPREWKEDRKK